MRDNQGSIKVRFFIGVVVIAACAALCLRIPQACAQQAPARIRADQPSSVLFDTWPEWKQRHETLVARVKQAKNVGMIFLGDSITQFWENEGAKQIWGKYYAPRNAINLGISGDQVQYCLWRLDNGELDGIKPKLVVVMIGTNNCWGDEYPVDETARGIKLIVQKIRQRLPQAKILLLAIFPRDQNPSPMRGKLLQVNQIISKLDDGKFVFCMDIGDKFIDDNGRIAPEIMPDYLHLTAKGYQIWADAIETKVAQLMGEKR